VLPSWLQKLLKSYSLAELEPVLLRKIEQDPSWDPNLLLDLAPSTTGQDFVEALCPSCNDQSLYGALNRLLGLLQGMGA